ncbi:MAG: hypothetical protein SGI90_10715 [Candidatus Eisenbacteria bacterium]|nr:hypothetical protein [Candidatus Eisenbacteria bacterium]
MLSLAAFRYRNVLASAGGPIERVEMAETVVLGERRFLANAYLVAELAGNREGNTLYSRANGSGTADSPMVARFMAISEAMERWAHWQLCAKPAGQKYGFDADPSSNGLAAFPGIWRRQARASARLEAAERFNLLNWWEGNLPAEESETRWPGVRAAVIRSPAPGLTAILFKRTEEGFFVYGHAAAGDFDAATRKAAGEMERHARVVSRFAHAHGGNIRNQLPASAHPIERRSLFFAQEEGHQLFLQRLRSPVQSAAVLNLVYDGPVPGPWTKYADVWRVVYAPPSRRFLGMEENYFMM